MKEEEKQGIISNALLKNLTNSQISEQLQKQKIKPEFIKDICRELTLLRGIK